MSLTAGKRLKQSIINERHDRLATGRKMKKIEKTNIEDIIPLSPIQEGILFHYMRDPKSEQYFEQLSLEIIGINEIDINRFQQAWNHIINTNEMLRTCFKWSEVKNPLQVVLKQHPLKIRYYNFSNKESNTSNEQKNLLEELKTTDRRDKFDLGDVPFRVTLCKMEGCRYHLIVSHHHILYDGWSSGILLKEFFNTYENLTRGTKLGKPVKAQFKEYIKWLQKQDKTAQESFWKGYLEGVDIPTSFLIKKVKPGKLKEAKSRGVRLSSEFYQQLECFVQEKRITAAALFYSAWGLLLRKYSQSEDVVFGTTVSGRNARVTDIEHTIGLFINTLPLRLFSHRRENIQTLLDNTQEMLKKREEYEYTSLADIGAWCLTDTRNELFDSVVVMENYPLDNQLFDQQRPLSILSYTMFEMTHYDLFLCIIFDNRIEVKFGYWSHLFDDETVIQLSRHYIRIVKEMISNPGKSRQIGEIDLLSETEKEKILYEFNDTNIEYQGEKTIHEWFEERVEKTPDKVALVGSENKTGDTVQFTYKDLNRKSHQLAQVLKNKGVKPDHIVGIMVDRSIEMVIGIMGILKAGGAYLPIAPNYPEARISYLMKDSNARILLSEVSEVSKVSEGTEVIKLSELSEKFPAHLTHLTHPTHLCYVIYTSGSTGEPKGVLIRHASVVNLLLALDNMYPLRESDAYLLKTTFLFDVSVCEIFGWFWDGGRLVVLEPGGEGDPLLIFDAIEREKITHINFVPSMFNVFVDMLNSQNISKLSSLRYIFLAGEAIWPDYITKFRSLVTNIIIDNIYGPTEATVYASQYPLSGWEGEGRIPIGKPIDNVKLYILAIEEEPQIVLQPVGIPGELCISGAGLARGYLNNPELTADKFISAPASNSSSSWGLWLAACSYRLYKTGDLARWLPDGNIEYFGRIDQQVKVRGFRVELGEIEQELLKHRDIADAVVIPMESDTPIQSLAAYIVSKQPLNVTVLKDHLSRRLPAYMIPDYFHHLDEIPLTATRKLDRKKLAAMSREICRSERYISPGTHQEKTIARAWKEVLGIEQIGIHDNFFDVGGNSLSLIRLNSKLQMLFNQEISIATLLRFTTISSQAVYFMEGKGEEDKHITPVIPESKESEIAVIGMAGRFPGSENISRFWENLQNGVETMTLFSDEELLEAGVEPGLLNNSNYVKVRGVLEDVEYFNSGFFGYSHRETELMDPQFRLFHECCWTALEDAGYVPDSFPGSIGLYAGSLMNPFWLERVYRQVNGYTEEIGASSLIFPDYLCTRTAYKLNLKGPAVTLQTACSTSLVAIATASQALLNGLCDMTLAGGVSLWLPQKTGYPYQEGMLRSADGHVRAFDAQARGTNGGSGVGIVVLKKLKEALADEDNIYAIVKGFAINNDGLGKAGYTAPGVEGQAAVIRAARLAANVEPETIGYIETHGTGTRLGDPVEIEALKLAFNTDKRCFCGIGSVKTNIGHLDVAAGVAGFIKTALALKHHIIPPSLHFQTPNPEIDFENSPFYVNTKAKAWNSENNNYPLRAGVSSFGIGGTNAHVVLEEWPEIGRSGDQRPEDQIIILSARSRSALDRMGHNLVSYLKQHTDNPGNPINLVNLGYTLQVGRKAFAYRRMLVCSSVEEVIEGLSNPDSRNTHTFFAGESHRPVVFVFSGLGAQYVNMGWDLYRTQAVFREEMDHCFQILDSMGRPDIREMLYPELNEIHNSSPSEEKKENLQEQMNRFDNAQLVVFLLEYTLARLLINWGINPWAMIGYSFGEYTAACISGVLSLEDALHLIALRGELIAELPAGAMLSVPLSRQEVKPFLDSDISIAIDNGAACIVAGPEEKIADLDRRLKEKKYLCMRVLSSHAIHSRMMDAIVKEFESEVDKVRLYPPRIPYISNVTGYWIKDQEAVDPVQWGRHLRETVCFADGIIELSKEPNVLFIEIGPGRDLSTLIKRFIEENPEQQVINPVRPSWKKISDTVYLLNKVGFLWLYGVEPAWKKLHENNRRRRLSLPTYPFKVEAHRYPVEEKTKTVEALEIPKFPPPGRYQRPELRSPYVEPKNKIERTLAAIWQKFFGIGQVGAHDDFFELGGDSLKVLAAAADIQRLLKVDVPISEFFNNPTVEKLAVYIEKTEKQDYFHIEPVEAQEYYRASSAQNRLFFFNQLENIGTAYNMPGIFKIVGLVDLERFEDAFSVLIAHHENLRTSFRTIGDNVVQIVHDTVEFEIERYHSIGEDAIPRLISRFIRPFNLAKPPLLRVGFVNLAKANDEFLLLFDMHHIIGDGASMKNLVDDFTALYDGKGLPLIPIQYKDFSQWQNHLFQGGGIKVQEEHWLRLYWDIDEIPRLNLPVDHPRPRIMDFKGTSYEFWLDSESVIRFKELAAEEGATLFMNLLAAFNALLYKYTDQGDIIVGCGVAGRKHTDLQGLIGMLVNTLAIRNHPRGDKTYREFLNSVKTSAIKAFENQDVSFESLVEKLNLERDSSRHPLFDVSLVLQSFEESKKILKDFTLEPLAFENKTSRFDITLFVYEVENRLFFYLEYSTALFKKETIQRLVNHFMILIRQVNKNPELRLADIDILTEEEMYQLLYNFNRTDGEFPGNKTIPGLFSNQVERTPDYIAVIGAYELHEISITYGELDRKSNQLAHLLKEKGVLADSIIGIKMKRSLEMIIGILGILKAGGAYLPIDPENPQERSDYMLKDSNAAFLVSEVSELSKVCGGTEMIKISELKEQLPSHLIHHTHPPHLCYIIYTSGTTGIPKGVLIRHRGVINLVYCHRSVFGEALGERISQVASPGFDAMAFEVWPCLLSGAALQIASNEIRTNPGRMKEWLIKKGINMSFQPTIMAEELLEEKWPKKGISLRVLRTAGDRLKKYPSRPYPFRFYNLYGPTEDTVWTTWTEVEVKTGTDTERYPTIGKPIENHRVYILSGNLKFQPIGAAGELCIAGEGLAVGYLNNPELTADKFISAPATSSSSNWGLRLAACGCRLYKTGDLARWLADGNIEFLGRIDYQVKIRGFRIELGEIESLVLKHGNIDKAAVIARETARGEKCLCAYIVPESGSKAPDPSQLREYLSQRLPAYMLPSYFVTLECLPLTTSGKVDRKALPEPELKTSEKHLAPANAIEETLVSIWSEILSISPEVISTDVNFFQLGGHSLKATIMISWIHRQLDIKVPLAELFITPTIRGLAQYIQSNAKVRYNTIRPVEEKEFYPLSSMQKRLYILQQIDKESTVYNLPAAVELEGTLDLQKLKTVFLLMIQRHESLRTAFELIDRETQQRILADVEFEIEYRFAVIRDFIRPFDLSKAPLLRVGLLEIDNQKHLLMIDMHHIISDGLSMGIFLREFMTLYGEETLPAITIHYKDFSQWHNHLLFTGRNKAQETFWLQEFPGDIPELNLPTDFPRPRVRSFDGNRLRFEIHPIDTERLNQLAAREKVTLYMVLLTVFNIMLSKISGQEEIVVGTAVAGRRNAELHQTIGMFVNTLALRNILQGHKTFSQFLVEVKQKTLTALENQDYPFEELVEKIDLTRDTSRNPIFDVIFALENIDLPELELAGLHLKPYEFENLVAKFDLTMTTMETSKGLGVVLEYCTKLFNESTIERFFQYFNATLRAALEKPEIKIEAIEIISKEDKRRILYDFNETVSEFPKEKTIQELFEEQVERRPDNIAVVGTHELHEISITNRELNRKSNQLAHHLQFKGVEPDTVVGIMMERSIEMIIGMMGILKAGGAYLPIDLEYPQERIDFMLKDSNAAVLVSEVNELSKVSEGTEMVKINELGEQLHTHLTHHTHPTHLCYIIYTSGSTGKPKGVMTTHYNVTRVVRNTNYIDIKPEDRILQLSNYAFDGSVFDIYSALLNSAPLVMIQRDDALAVSRLAEKIKRESITVFFVTTALFNALVDLNLDCLVSIRKVLFGGERVSLERCKRALEYLGKQRIIHVYGPTETTVYATYYFIDNIASTIGTIPIGKPIANTTVYILDKNMKPVPIGVHGEVYIGGTGTARGYLNNPELTTEKFDQDLWDYQDYHDEKIKDNEKFLGVQGPFFKKVPGRRRLYKTGDLARWLPDGNIEFIGRIDHQVKIRGFRIELGEIENRLLEVEEIKEVVVIARDDNLGQDYLCAYIVSLSDVNPQEIKAGLSRTLPSYMIPAHVVKLDRIPLTSNNKINRKALPALELKAGESYAAPGNEVELKMVELWSEMLAIEKEVIGINDDFFELGGHSIKASLLAARIHETFQVNIPLREIFTTSCLSGMCRYITETKEREFKSVASAEEMDYYPLSTAQKGLFVQHQRDMDTIGYNIPQIMQLDFDINKERLEQAIKTLIARHDILRVSFRLCNKIPVQTIQSEVAFAVEYYDAKGKELKEIMGDFVRSFDLVRPPLLRVRLIRLEDKKHLLMLDVHHIISDGVSLQLFREELTALYHGKQLSPLKIQYKDYAVWQNREEIKGNLNHQKEFWLNMFKGEIPVLKLPTDFKRSPLKSFEGSHIVLTVGHLLSEKLNRLSAQTGTTLYMVLLAAYFVLLGQYSNQEDMVVGSPVTGRRHADLQNILGMFVNMLAIRAKVQANKTFGTLLQEVKEIVIGCMENQEYHYEELVVELGLHGDPSRNPLFDVVLAMQDLRADHPGSQNQENGGYGFEYNISKFDLLMNVGDTGKTIELMFEYSTQLFKCSTVEDIAKHYIEILEQVIEKPEVLLKNIKMSYELIEIESTDIREEGDFAF
jgi:amino acid adenylation domain-containing protein